MRTGNNRKEKEDTACSAREQYRIGMLYFMEDSLICLPRIAKRM